MLKLKIHILLIVSILLLSSCSLGRIRINMLNEANDGGKADARLEKIIQTINNHDKNALLAMFSQKVQDEAENLDDGIEYVFILVKGNIESWERIGGSVDESIKHNNTVVKSRYRYIVHTDEQQYLFSVLEYTKDTDNPDNVGIYSLKIINTKDIEPTFSDAGIYRPKE